VSGDINLIGDFLQSRKNNLAIGKLKDPVKSARDGFCFTG
jgi:hypothetical protein